MNLSHGALLLVTFVNESINYRIKLIFTNINFTQSAPPSVNNWLDLISHHSICKTFKVRMTLLGQMYRARLRS